MNTDILKNFNSLSEFIRTTRDYQIVCDRCKDEVTVYPTISGRTEYSQAEVEYEAFVSYIRNRNGSLG